MIITAFIGYVLAWGQMSFWGATVITSLASAIPVVGDSIVQWLWGGFSVDNATLNRFFSLHYLLPFIIAGASLLHIAALHQYGSNNPLGVQSATDRLPLFPLFYVKDLVAWLVFALVFSGFVFYAPNYLGHSDNYIPANPLSTPAHIVPEWYFLPVYAILRSIPDKLLGVGAIGLVFVSLFLLPFLHTSPIRSHSFRPLSVLAFWLLVADVVILGWIGMMPVEPPYLLLGQIASVYFFVYFLVLVPALGHLEALLVRWKDTEAL
jgi:ubiquinol-cytochrome c reductase cytochrome b subunit